MNDILNFREVPITDETIEEYEYHEYEPITGTNLNNSGEIRITIQNQDIFTHPANSYLLVEGRLTKQDDAAYADDNAIALTNNGIMHLFNNIKYQLSEQEIESLFYPGQATTMLGLLKYPDDLSKSVGLNQLWCKDTAVMASIANNAGFGTRQKYLVQLPNPKGTFSFKIPLKHILGSFEDYDKIVCGFTQRLTLVRKADSDAIFKADGADAGKVNIQKISWFMPHVLPADGEKLKLYKTIESKSKLPVAYRMRQCDSIAVSQSTSFTWRLSVKSSPEKPRYIIVAFQTEKDADQTKNPSIFDHVNLTDMFVMLNSTRYPVVDYNVSFPKQQFSRLYGDAASFRSKFYSMDELVSNPNITPDEFKSLYPIFVFDVSKESERLKTQVTDIQIKASFNENVPANTQAYAVVISDRLLSFQSDGHKMTVVM